MNKKAFASMLLIIALFCSMSFTCYAANISITDVSFEKYTDQYGNENDANIFMKVVFTAPAETTQISVCVLGENIDDITVAQENNKLIYMNQQSTPSDGVLWIPLSKAAISTATGEADINGVTVYIRLGGKTVSDMVTKEVKVSLPKEDVLRGDVTGDGQVNSTDATQILRYNARLRTFTETQIAAGDVTGDGEIDIFDAVWVLKYAAGLIKE